MSGTHDSEHKKRERPASQDVADLTPEPGQGPGHAHGGQGHSGAAHGSAAKGASVMGHWAEGGGSAKTGDAKKNEGDGLERRMVHDERFSEDEDVVQNGEGRIINVSIVGGRTRITIGLGRKQGVRVGMEGYVKKGDGMLADFQIDSTGDRTATAMVDATPDMLHDHNMVMVNPSHMPKSSEPQKDMKSRVVGVSIIGGRTQILIGRGISHGARPGMAGYLVGSGGKPFAKFHLEEVGASASKAFIDYTIDQIKDHHEAILNPGA